MVKNGCCWLRASEKAQKCSKMRVVAQKRLELIVRASGRVVGLANVLLVSEMCDNSQKWC